MWICLLLAAWKVSVLAADVAPAEPSGFLRRVATVQPDPSSGRLVRRVVVQPRVVQPVLVKEKAMEGNEQISLPLAPDPAVNEIIEQAAREHDVDPLLVHSVIQVESGYDRFAVSPKGALGLMQLIPATARRFGVSNPFDVRQNIQAGVKYLRQLQMMFKDARLALAAYNAGEGAVMRYKDIPPYAETQHYVYQVGKRWGEARRAAEQSRRAAAGQPEQKRIRQFVDQEGRLHLMMQ